MSETIIPTLPKLPSLHLPSESTRHLRALIYASIPGNLITNLSQHVSITHISLTLSQTPPLTPLYHAPHPNIPHNKNFLSEFPLTACYTPPLQQIVLHTTLPDFMHTLSEEIPIPQGSLADSPTSVLLKTGSARVSNGLVQLDSGCYNPLMEFPRSGTFDEIVGAWGMDDVSVTTGLLRLARFLYRRSNRRLRTNGSRAVRKEVVLLRFRDEGITVRRGWIGVSGVRRWVCYLPLTGGTGRFVPVDTRGRRDLLDLLHGVTGNARNLERRVERSAPRSAPRNTSGNGDLRTRRRNSPAVQNGHSAGNGAEREGVEEEIMVWKMREFNFGGPDDRNVGDVQESAVEVQNVDETVEGGMSKVRVVDVDVDTLANTTISTTTTSSSSDSEREEAMLETLCQQYLDQGYHESVEHELRR